MPCLYCRCYAQSLRRLGPDEEGKSNKTKGRRLCETTRAWKSAGDEICDDFKPNSTFWCDKLEQMTHIDACRNRRTNIKAPECKRCRQYSDILDVIRFRARLAKAEPSENATTKPVLLRRK